MANKPAAMKEIKQLSDQDLKEAVNLGELNRSGLKPEFLPEFDARMKLLSAELQRRIARSK